MEVRRGLYLLLVLGVLGIPARAQKHGWWKMATLSQSADLRYGRYRLERTDTTDDGTLTLVNKRGEFVFGVSHNNTWEQGMYFEIYCPSMPKGAPGSPALVSAMQAHAALLTRELVKDAVLRTQLLTAIHGTRKLRKDGDGKMLLDCQAPIPQGYDLSDLYATVKILEPGVWLVTLFARYPV